MEITQIKFDFNGKPRLRKTDTLTSSSAKLIICGVNSSYIDITGLHYKAQSEGKSGIPYHYIVKNDGTYYYARPKIYQNELTVASPSDVISNSITLLVAGEASSALSESMKSAVSKFCVFLLEQEKLTLSSVVMQHTLVNDKNTTQNWFDLFLSIKSAMTDRNIYKTFLEEQSNSGVNSVSMHDQIITTPKLNSMGKVSDITGVSKVVLASYNPNYSSSATIAPNKVIYVPKNKYSLKTIANQQISIASYAMEKINQTVTYKTLENAKYVEAKKQGKIFDAYDITTLSTNYGGKKAPRWYSEGIELPGYHNAQIHFIHNFDPSKNEIFNFALSPSAFNDTRSVTQQMTKTTAGWFVQRTGKSPYSVSFSGYMLDTRKQLERHDFLEMYKRCAEDERNEKFESFYKYSTKVFVEGRAYYGYIQSINFSKSSLQPFLYQYGINFLILSEQKVYDPAQAAKPISELMGIQGTTLTSLPEIKKTPMVISPSQYLALNSLDNKVLASKIETNKAFFLSQAELDKLMLRDKPVEVVKNSVMAKTS